VKTAVIVLLAFFSALAVQPAHARRTLEIRDVSPKPAVLRDGVAEVTVSVHAKWGTPENCSAAVQAEEHSAPPTLQFGPGLPQTQEIVLKYTRPGNYNVRVGSNARDGGSCGSVAQTVVRVVGDGPQKAATPACPDGWAMATNEGARFTCRLIPPPALACPAGTTYFSQGTQIGCK
jgi:hypothetical protein